MKHFFARRLAWWLIAWMALVSLHSALAATLVLAGGGGGAEMVEVCTNQGVRWVSVQATQSGTDPAQATATGSPGDTADDHSVIGADGTPHCPLCRFVGDAAPDLSRSDLRFAAPLRYRAPPPDAAPPLSPAARAVLTSPPRAPPVSRF